MFTPRTKKPDNTNKYYISSRFAGKNGWNPCILGNPNTTYGRDKNLNVLPNCVGWEVGRFNEIVGERNCKYLYIIGGKNHARDLVNNAKKQGLEVGMEPRLGAAIVWSGGTDGYGHTGGVEAISADKKRIRISQSGWSYNGPNHMWFADHYIGTDGNWIEGGDYNWMKNKNYKILGFIYQPEKKEDDMITQAEFDKMMDNWLERKANADADAYAKASLEWAKDKGLMSGRPQSFAKREELAEVLYRLKNLLG